MSTYEYNDLFLKCQPTGLYHVFTFDIKDSKLMDYKTRNNARIKMLKFMTLMYNTIYQKALIENKKILVYKKDYVRLGSSHLNEFGFKQEPFILGDLVGFTVYRDSITNEEVMKIYEECKKEVVIDFEFHIADGYYETDNWCEAKEKYFRGHCIDLLSNLHKPYNKEIRKKLLKLNNK